MMSPKSKVSSKPLDADKQYEVQKLLGKRVKDGIVQYRVKWDGKLMLNLYFFHLIV